MKFQQGKKISNKNPDVDKNVSYLQKSSVGSFQFQENRPEMAIQRKMQQMANEYSGNRVIQPKANNTGLPNQLKSGIENLSGFSMDDVKVHYNSPKPAQLQAHAYAQGSDIHVASGQEKHLPHEAWHVVQQKQGRVRPTMQMKGTVNINDDIGLEKEADVMGVKAIQMKQHSKGLFTKSIQNVSTIQRAFDPPTNSAENAVFTLANMTATGRAAIAAGNGKLTIAVSSGWKTLTQGGRIGIGIPEAAYIALSKWGGNHDIEFPQKDDFSVLIAHELTHLRHHAEVPGTYAVRGQRENVSGWDADPEEELTVKGETRIPLDAWQHLYRVAYEASGMEALLVEKAGYEHELTTATGGFARNFRKHLGTVEDKIAAIQLDTTPRGAEIVNGFYVFRDPHNENQARAESGFTKRDSYTDGSFTKSRPVRELGDTFRFNQIDKRLHQLSIGIRELKRNLSEMQERLARLEADLIRIGKDLDTIKARLDKL